MTRLNLGYFLVILLVSLSFAASTQGITLVRDGKPESVIVTANNPTVVQHEAAKELQYHIRKMSGALLPIATEDQARNTDKTLILVGQSSLLTESGIDTSKLDPETFIVKTGKNVLVLAGDDTGSQKRNEPFYSTDFRSGTLFAVYDFLHDELGCRWVWPGETGEVIPQQTTIEVSDLDVQETPTMMMRHFRSGIDYAEPLCEAGLPRYFEQTLEQYHAGMSQDQQRWLKRMMFGRSDKPQYGHAFTDWYDKYFKDQPDLFALQKDGKRGLPNDSYPSDFVKICISNDKVIDIMIDEFKARRAKNPNYLWINACENDGSLGFCQCDDCRAWDIQLDEQTREKLAARGLDGSEIDDIYGDRGDGLPSSLSNRYFHFYNKLAKRLAEIAPDAYVVVYAYSRYRFAPVGMELEPNILVGLIGFNNYPASPAARDREVSNLMAWKDSGIQKLFFRPNSFFFSPAHGIPWDASMEMGDDLKLLIDNGIIATDFDILNGHWSTASPTFYVLARQHWDHDVPVADLRREFMETFGPAADSIEAYFDLWAKAFKDAYMSPDIDELSKQADPYGGDIGRRKAVALFLTDEDFARAHELLDKARAEAESADDPSLLQRLHVLDLGLEHGEAMMAGAQFMIDKDFEKTTRFEDFWPKAVKIQMLREDLVKLGAHDVYWLDAFELRMHDMYGTRVFYDFANRPYAPVLEPAEADWVMVPDPEDQGEAESWFAKTLEEPGYMNRNPRYVHLFYSDWDTLKGVVAWKRKTGHKQVINGWYQTQITVAESDLKPGNVLYVPYIKGSAKIWIDDTLVREVSAAEGAGDDAIVLQPSAVGIEADKPFRLTIKVTSPRKGGGLIGPVYVAQSTSP